MTEVARRPGGRSARIRGQILTATRELLLERGLGEVTIPDIASRAGVHHTSIYRNWSDRGALLRDTLLELVSAAAPVPDTGQLESDLLTLVDEINGMYESPIGRVLLDLTRSSEEALIEFRVSYWRARLSSLSVIIDRAVERGEVAPGTDPVLIFELMLGPIFSRQLLLNSSLRDLSSHDIVNALLHGLREGTEGN